MRLLFVSTLRVRIHTVFRLMLCCGLTVTTAVRAQAPCPVAPHSVVLEQGGRQVVVTPDPPEVAVSRPFFLDIRVCSGSGRVIGVDARMPLHGHGMNYRPTLVEAGPFHYRAEGMLLHMPGEWELGVELEDGGAVIRLSETINLVP